MASKVLATGTVVRLTNGKTATVICKLGEGGQGRKFFFFPAPDSVCAGILFIESPKGGYSLQ